MASDNPHYDILVAVKALLEENPPIGNLPTPSIREIPYQVGSDTLPLCLVCPAPEGEELADEAFDGIEVWAYPVLVLLIHAANRQLQTGLEARLKMKRAVRQRLFVPTLPPIDEVTDVSANPKAVADVQAALGAQVVVSGLLVRYQTSETRER